MANWKSLIVELLLVSLLMTHVMVAQSDRLARSTVLTRTAWTLG